MWGSAVQICSGLLRQLEVFSQVVPLKEFKTVLNLYRFGGVAQLARAPALHAGGHRFDSDILHTFLAMEKSSLTYWIENTTEVYNTKKVSKGAWRMPWLSEAMKDVITCDKPR